MILTYKINVVMKAVKLGLLSAALLLASSGSVEVNAQSQKQKGKVPQRTKSTLVNQYRKAIAKVALTAKDLYSYKAFKKKLGSTVAKAYKGKVVSTDAGFVDNVLRPIYSGLLNTKIRNDKQFSVNAKLNNSNVKIGFLRNSKVVILQEIEYSPTTLQLCGKASNSSNLPCLGDDKKIDAIIKQSKTQPSKKELQYADVFIEQVKSGKYPRLAKAVKGINLEKTSKIKLSYIAFLLEPKRRNVSRVFLPPAVVAYAKISEGKIGGSQSGNPPVPSDIDPGKLPGVAPYGKLKSSFPGSLNDSRQTWNPEAIRQDFQDLASFKPHVLYKNSHRNTDVAWRTTGNHRTDYSLVNGFTFRGNDVLEDNSTLIRSRCINTLILGRWCSPRYWVGYKISYDYAFGLRVPFNVTTRATGNNQRGSMGIQMRTGNLNSDAYQRSGLPQGDILGGREAIAEICTRNCRVELLGDIPFWDPLSTDLTKWNFPKINFLRMLPSCRSIRDTYGRNVECQSIDQLRQGSVNWPNVGSRSDLAKYVVNDIDLFGGSLNYSFIGAEAHPYISVYLSGYKYDQYWRSASSSARRNISIDPGESSFSFDFRRLPRQRRPMVTGKGNVYKLRVGIVPGIRLAGWFGPYDESFDIDLDPFKYESPSLPFRRHANSYNGAWTQVPMSQ